MSVATKTEVAGEVTVTPIHVDVYADLKDEMVLFSHVWKEPGGTKKKKGKIEVNQKDTPIHFHLHDDTGLGLAFCATASDAMWVDLKDCPTCAGNGGQITFDSSAPKLLKVSDANLNPPCTLHYALRFTGNPTTEDSPPYEYDPEIKNV
jgi:hypothetical protein